MHFVEDPPEESQHGVNLSPELARFGSVTAPISRYQGDHQLAVCWVHPEIEGKERQSKRSLNSLKTKEQNKGNRRIAE